ncbi:MAG: LuxR C-terminal-related transcriptional regulator [Chloroflexota bacterium]|nr:LuxR C-terminal-related transcriptional regulator [Chloroflexota bacterium]
MQAILRAFDSAADGVFVIDEDQRIVYWNRAAQDILGYRPEDVLGRSCHEIIRGRDDDDRAWCRANCHVTLTAQAGDQIDTFNTCARAKSGELAWINVTILSLRLSEEVGLPLVVHLFRDASQIKQQEQFTREITSVVQALDQPPSVSPVAPQTTDTAPSNLTAREQEVLVLMAHGLSTGEISSTLSISSSTTRNHIQNILQKLRVHSRAAAVAYAYEHGLLSS